MDTQFLQYLPEGLAVKHSKANSRTPEHWGASERWVRAPGFYPGSLSYVLSGIRPVSVDIKLSSVSMVRGQAIEPFVADLMNVQERLSVALGRQPPREQELIVWDNAEFRPLLRIRFLKSSGGLWNVAVHHYLREFICDFNGTEFGHSFVESVEASATNVIAGRRYCIEGKHFFPASSAVSYGPDAVVCRKHYDPAKHKEIKE